MNCLSLFAARPRLDLSLTRGSSGQAPSIWWPLLPLGCCYQGEFSILSLFTGPIGAVAQSTHDPGLLYLGGTEGLFVSRDRGGHWELLNQELCYPHILLVDPHQPSRLHAVRRNLRPFTPRAGIYRSDDGGKSWQQPQHGLQQECIFALAADPFRTDVLYAGTEGGRLYRSSDGGVCWQPACPEPRGLGPHAFPGIIGQLLCDPLDGALYAAQEGAGLFRSPDGGETWRQLHKDSGRLALDEHRGQLYLAGRKLWRSPDGGEHWQCLSAGLSWQVHGGIYAPSWIALNPSCGALYTRQHRSVDEGASWEPLETPRGFIPRLLLPGTRTVIYGSVQGQTGRYCEVGE
ncbi:MAG: hypothetical protein JXA37_08115 [Chloroflexia bacterium]|nr:hypothetical protein [Chloroflexia bacterium]